MIERPKDIYRRGLEDGRLAERQSLHKNFEKQFAEFIKIHDQQIIQKLSKQVEKIEKKVERLDSAMIDTNTILRWLKEVKSNALLV